MSEDPQTAARNMIEDVGSSTGASLRVIGHPVKYSEQPTSIHRRAPNLGEHTAEVLAEAGYDRAEITALAEAGSILLGAEKA